MIDINNDHYKGCNLLYALTPWKNKKVMFKRTNEISLGPFTIFVLLFDFFFNVSLKTFVILDMNKLIWQRIYIITSIDKLKVVSKT